MPILTILFTASCRQEEGRRGGASKVASGSAAAEEEEEKQSVEAVLCRASWPEALEKRSGAAGLAGAGPREESSRGAYHLFPSADRRLRRRSWA